MASASGIVNQLSIQYGEEVGRMKSSSSSSCIVCVEDEVPGATYYKPHLVQHWLQIQGSGRSNAAEEGDDGVVQERAIGLVPCRNRAT